MNAKLEASVIFQPILNLIHEIGDHFFEVKEREENIVVYKSVKTSENKYSISFVFWVKENRLSFFVFDFEILDEYINSEKEAKVLSLNLRVLLSNKVERISFCSKKGQLKKETLKYTQVVENVEKQISENVLSKFIFPWTKTETIVHVFDNWIL